MQTVLLNTHMYFPSSVDSTPSMVTGKTPPQGTSSSGAQSMLEAASGHDPYKETNGIWGHSADHWSQHPTALHFVGCPALLVLRSAC